MSALLTINEIKKLVDDILVSIEAPKRKWPYLSYNEPSPLDDATPFVEIRNGRYHYVISERGTEYERLATFDIKELLYWIFRSIAFNISSDYAAKNPVQNFEHRRIAFNKQLEYLAKINPEYANRERAEIEKILEKAPFDDGGPNELEFHPDPLPKAQD